MNDGTTTGGRTESPANRERNRHGTDGVRGAHAGDPLTTREYGTGTPRGGRRNQTDTGGRTYGDKGARGPGGATPQELGGLGLVPQGGSRDLGPTGCMDGRKQGGWGTPPPHTKREAGTGFPGGTQGTQEMGRKLAATTYAASEGRGLPPDTPEQQRGRTSLPWGRGGGLR